jgi:hypothetical protein
MTEVQRVTTESGTTYDFWPGMTYVRRNLRGSRPMRRDGEWVPVVGVNVGMGKPMVLHLTGVAETGDTMRTTTPVVSIEPVEVDWNDNF